MEKLSSLNEKRREQLSPIKQSTAYAKNQATLNKLGEENGNLTFDGKPVGGVEKRPTAEYTYDFIEDYRMYYTGESQSISLYIPEEESTDAEKALIGKEIADVEFERSTGEWILLKNASEVDLIPFVSMLNHVAEKTIEDISSIVFVSVYYPSSVGWLHKDINNSAISKMRIAYYTD